MSSTGGHALSVVELIDHRQRLPDGDPPRLDAIVARLGAGVATGRSPARRVAGGRRRALPRRRPGSDMRARSGHGARAGRADGGRRAARTGHHDDAGPPSRSDPARRRSPAVAGNRALPAPASGAPARRRRALPDRRCGPAAAVRRPARRRARRPPRPHGGRRDRAVDGRRRVRRGQGAGRALRGARWRSPAAPTRAGGDVAGGSGARRNR